MFGNGHLQLGLPRMGQWMEPSLVRNPFVEQVAAALLGRCAFSFCSGNTNTPGSGTQPMHADGDWPAKTESAALAKGLEWPPAPIGLIVNFGVGDIDSSNGATQIWPRSHSDVRAPGSTRGGTLEESWPDVIADRNTTDPPIANSIPFGGVGFRDPRLWHRGIPHTGELPRHMIAFVYKQLAPNDKVPPLAFSSSARAAFEPTSMRRSAACDMLDFSGLSFDVGGPVDHFGNAMPAENAPAPNHRTSSSANKEKSLEKQYRDKFWMPDELPDLSQPGADPVPAWVYAVAAGQPLERFRAGAKM